MRFREVSTEAIQTDREKNMSRIGQLTRQMNELQAEIARLQRESADRDTRYQQEHQLRMHQLKRTMENALQRHNTQLVQQTQQEMEALYAEMISRIEQNHESLKRELTENLEVRHRELLKQIEQYYQDVQNRIDTEVTDVMKESDIRKRELAQREYAAACEQHRVLAGRAHAELFPGRLAIYEGTLGQAQRMMEEQRQYEASAATSVMLKADLKDLEYHINEKLTRWIQSYLPMEQNYQNISDRVKTRVLTVDGKKISRDTAMHWTGHKYDTVFECLDRVQNIIEETEYHQRLVRDEVLTIASVEDYVKTGEAPTGRELDENNRVLKYELPEKLEKLEKELASAYRCSAQRKVWAEKIGNYMSEKHCTGSPCYNGFFEEDGKEADERALYRMEFEKPGGNGRKNRYTVHIVPVTENGSMQNRIRILMNFRLGTDQYQRKQEVRYIAGILHAIGEKKAYVAVGTGPDVLTGDCDEEYSLEQSASGSGELLVSHTQKPSGASRKKKAPEKGRGGMQEKRQGTVKTKRHSVYGNEFV